MEEALYVFSEELHCHNADSIVLREHGADNMVLREQHHVDI